MTTSRDTIIVECCLDEGRPGKLMETLVMAKARDPGIRLADVRGWMLRHGDRMIGGAGVVGNP